MTLTVGFIFNYINLMNYKISEFGFWKIVNKKE